METSVMINFRVKPEERTQLRVALLQRGQTIQDYFAGIVARILEKADETTKASGRGAVEASACVERATPRVSA
jgi:hypothetical protein